MRWLLTNALAGGVQDFKTYLRLSAELQRIQMVGMSREQTLAMFINLYNALVIHAYIQIGPPTSAWKRRKFFHKAAYKIGGHTFSLNDIEHGILRGNRKPAPVRTQRPAPRVLVAVGRSAHSLCAGVRRQGLPADQELRPQQH